METAELNVITGAFGYIGKYITLRLLSQGKRVRTLTNHPGHGDFFHQKVDIAPLNFQRPEQLVESLRGATTLYNTYWVRFPYGQVTFETAVANTRTLVKAAQEAGIRRIVHVSITNASESSPLPYFRGKGLVERAIMDSGLSYAIVRPTVVFGDEDILINNMAWLLRRFPLFVVFGSGEYRLQPVYVEDLAQIAVNAGQQREDMVLDAVGPEVYTFEDLVRLIAGKTRSRARIVHLRPGLALLLGKLMGYGVRDVIVTRDEVRGLTASLLLSQAPPTGQMRLGDWLEEHAESVGRRYASELARHYR
ncbi:MAG: NAD-dependent epimerase/dehydratase family protein [Dehalococcoidia bacterium]|nr:NAD-dependent epimerase/dehydratase family protein [Dehalococcoidia bacterium]